METIDLILIAILLVSFIFALFRGFVKESISLATLIMAFVVTVNFMRPLGSILPESLVGHYVRLIVASVVLFVGTLIIGNLIGFFIGRFVKSTGLKSTDRFLGGIFGLIRGAIVACIFVITGIMTEQITEDKWNDAVLLPHFFDFSMWILTFDSEELISVPNSESP